MSATVPWIAGFLSILLTCSVDVLASDTLYRWKDDQGNMVMSDRPPVGVEYETISTRSSLVHKVENQTAPIPEPKAAAPESGPEPTQTAAPTRTSVTKKNPEYCESARKNLEVIDRAPRIRMKDENGEMRYITDEERAEQRQLNLDTIAAHCE